MSLPEPNKLEALKFCPTKLPDDLRQHINALAEAWMQCPLRLSLIPAMQKHWDKLIRAWADAPAMPLLVRKHRDNRGSELVHSSGRKLIPVDNSAAHWAYIAAVCGVPMTLSKAKEELDAGRLPVAMIFKKEERKGAKYLCTRAHMSLNDLEWKVCHIDGVGLKSAGSICEMPIDRLKDHFIRYMSPSNMFVVPKRWSGLGEMPEMVEAARKAAKIQGEYE